MCVYLCLCVDDYVCAKKPKLWVKYCHRHSLAKSNNYRGLLTKVTTAGLFYQKSHTQSSQNSTGEISSSSMLDKIPVRDMLFTMTPWLHALLEIDKEKAKKIQSSLMLSVMAIHCTHKNENHLSVLYFLMMICVMTKWWFEWLNWAQCRIMQLAPEL